MFDELAEQVEALRARCVLLVHPDIGRLSTVTRIARTRGWEPVSIGAELSAALLGKPTRLRPREAHRWTLDRLAQAVPGLAVCTEVDLLFEPALALDPLQLFKQASRLARLVVAWPGSYEGDVLVYAVPEHGHFRIWSHPEIPIISVP